MRIPRPTLVLVAAISFFAVISLSAADDLQAVYARIDGGAARFKGMTADIRRVTHMELIGEDDVETGKIMVKRSKPKDIKMRIDIDQADHSSPKQYAFSGTRADIYYPKTNTDEIYDLGKHRGLLEQFLLLGFGTTSAELRGAYSIRLEGKEAVNGEPAWRIELLPKSKDIQQMFPRIELWISVSSGIAVEQKLYEKGGKDYHLFTYSNIQFRPDIPDSEVKLDIPKNAVKTYPLK